MKFFNIPQSRNESSDTCTETLLEFLHNTVPNKQWSRDDIVRAHRLGNNNNNNGYSKPQPIIAKFAKWSDKMDILTKGTQQLKQKGVRVAGDLTTRQQKVIKDYRDRGQRAYSKDNKLVVAGSLPPRRWNQDSYADAARRQHHRQDNPGTAASRGRRRANIYRTSNPGNGRGSSAEQADSWQQTTHGTADDYWGGWLPYTSSWMGNSNFNQSYGEAQAREVHPLEQLPPYAPAPYGWGGQDYQRYTGWGDEDFRHCGNTNGRTQSIEHTQDHAHSEVAPTADWQDYCDTADNSRVMLDSCRLHTDNDHANDVAADPEEARVEACPTTEYTDDAQQEGNAPGTSDATASRQGHSETVSAGTEEKPQQEQTQTSHSYTRKCQEGYPNRKTLHRNHPPRVTQCVLTPKLRAHDHHVISFLNTTGTVPLVWLCQQRRASCTCRMRLPLPRRRRVHGHSLA